MQLNFHAKRFIYANSCFGRNYSQIYQTFFKQYMNETQKSSLFIRREKTKLNATHAIPKNLDTGEVNVALEE